MAKRMMLTGSFLLFAFGFAWACGFDSTLRAYLDSRFWLPFSKSVKEFERSGIRRVNVPFAGMEAAEGDSPLANLRATYQQISQPMTEPFNAEPLRDAVAAARADQTLTQREREVVDLIDAKIDMRSGQPDEPKPLQEAKEKFQRFLTTAHTPEFLSEARGWLAYVHYLLKEQTPAGKMYLDEWNHDGSNLSREKVLNSLRMNYGYDGGADLLTHLDEYFDTLVTEPEFSVPTEVRENLMEEGI